MIGPGLPGAVLEAFAENFATGQAGTTLGVTIDDGDGNNVVARTTASIVEIETVGDLGVYRYLGTFPTDPALSPYAITWDGLNALGDETTATETIEVSTDAPAEEQPVGPCSPWVTSADLECCADEIAALDTSSVRPDQVAAAASDVLYELSGGLFSGLCGPVTVRPCRTGRPCHHEWAGWERGASCGCGHLSRVKLGHVNVVAIAQVKIDGDIVPPSSYRLDGNRWLTRKRDALYPNLRAHWPACQQLDLDDDQEGTFSVSYWYGMAPPTLGVLAAEQLACEMLKACDDTAECALPSGTTQVTRAGVTVNVQALTALARGDDGTWRTGMALVDTFLNTYNPTGHSRPATVWSPDVQPPARRVG